MTCTECGRPFRTNWTRSEVCRDCRRDARELDQLDRSIERLARAEEELEESMGPTPDYVTGTGGGK